MEKSDILKIIIQYLNENGFKDVSCKLEEESNYKYESVHLKNLILLIKEAMYEDAIKLVIQFCSTNESIYIIPKIRLVQIFESLLKDFKNKKETIELIRKICNSNNDYEKHSSIEKCSSLIFIKKKSELLKKIKEISPSVNSKETLIDYILSTLTKSSSLLKTLYPKSLETMIDNVIQNQIKNCIYHTLNKPTAYSYFEDHQCKITNIPTKCILTIEKHEEEILNLIPSNSGSHFAAVLKSNFIAIYKLIWDKDNSQLDIENYSYKSSTCRHSQRLNICMISIFKAHENQITSVEWNNSENLIITASKDKTIKLFDIQTGECKLKIESHQNMISCAILFQNEKSILSSCYGKKLTLWDLKGNIIESIDVDLFNEIRYSKKTNLIILIPAAIKSIILYNYDEKSEVDRLNLNDTIASSALSNLDQGEFLLVNSSNSTPVLMLWNISTRTLIQKYFGHRQDKLTTKCAFGGQSENFLICGSDSKEIYIWNKKSSIPILFIKAHGSSVNTAIWPYSSYFSSFIVSGSDDHTIKIFSNDLFENAILIDKDTINIEERISNGHNSKLNSSNNNYTNNINNLDYIDNLDDEVSDDSCNLDNIQDDEDNESLYEEENESDDWPFQDENL